MDALNKYELAEIDYTSGMKYKDIAKKYGVSINTVKSWKTRYAWQKKGVHTKEKVCTQKKSARGSSKIPKVDKVLTEPLNANQRLFCEIYASNRNATIAYIRAYGVSNESADTLGPRLLGNIRVRAYVDELLRIKREAIFFEPDDLIEKQMRIAFANITDYVTFGQEVVPVMGAFGPVQIKDELTGKKVTLTKLANTVKFKESYEVDGGLIKEVKLGKDGASIKLADQQKAMDWLANYFMLNPADKHKQDYDKKKLELEEKANEAKIENLKANTAKLKGEEPDDLVDDGFIEALKSEAGKIWEE